MSRRQAVGQRVIRALEAAELTQTDVAKKLRLHPGNFSRMLHGERVLAPYLGKIARICGVTEAWLLGAAASGPAGSKAGARRGRAPDPDLFIRRLSPSEHDMLGRTKEAWLLPRSVSHRVMAATIHAARERTSVDEAKGDRVLLVVIRGGKRVPRTP